MSSAWVAPGVRLGNRVGLLHAVAGVGQVARPRLEAAVVLAGLVGVEAGHGRVAAQAAERHLLARQDARAPRAAVQVEGLAFDVLRRRQRLVRRLVRVARYDGLDVAGLEPDLARRHGGRGPVAVAALPDQVLQHHLENARGVLDPLADDRAQRELQELRESLALRFGAEEGVPVRVFEDVAEHGHQEARRVGAVRPAAQVVQDVRRRPNVVELGQREVEAAVRPARGPRRPQFHRVVRAERDGEARGEVDREEVAQGGAHVLVLGEVDLRPALGVDAEVGGVVLLPVAHPHAVLVLDRLGQLPGEPHARLPVQREEFDHLLAHGRPTVHEAVVVAGDEVGDDRHARAERPRAVAPEPAALDERPPGCEELAVLVLDQVEDVQHAVAQRVRVGEGPLDGARPQPAAPVPDRRAMEFQDVAGEHEVDLRAAAPFRHPRDAVKEQPERGGRDVAADPDLVDQLATSVPVADDVVARVLQMQVTDYDQHGVPPFWFPEAHASSRVEPSEERCFLHGHCKYEGALLGSIPEKEVDMGLAGDFDAIVIGSGFGGAVAITKLAAAGKKVLVLERGTWWRNPEGPGLRSDKVKSDKFKIQGKWQYWGRPNDSKGLVYVANSIYKEHNPILDLVNPFVRDNDIGPKKNTKGMYRLTRFSHDRGNVDVVSGSAVGGGSLFYSGVNLIPHAPVLDRIGLGHLGSADFRKAGQWMKEYRGQINKINTKVPAPHRKNDNPAPDDYQLAVIPESGDPHPPADEIRYETPNPLELETHDEYLLLDRARVLKRAMQRVLAEGGFRDGASQGEVEDNKFEPLPLSVLEYDTDADGESQKKNTFCLREGRCVLGCLPSARHTLYKTIQKRIEKGEQITVLPLARVSHIDRAGGGYTVHFESELDAATSATAEKVFVAGGCLGTSEIMLRSAKRHDQSNGAEGLPLSGMVGKGFSTNGDFFAFTHDMPRDRDTRFEVDEKDRIGNANPTVGPLNSSHFYVTFDKGTPQRVDVNVEDGGIPPTFARLVHGLLPHFSDWDKFVSFGKGLIRLLLNRDPFPAHDSPDPEDRDQVSYLTEHELLGNIFFYNVMGTGPGRAARHVLPAERRDRARPELRPAAGGLAGLPAPGGRPGATDVQDGRRGRQRQADGFAVLAVREARHRRASPRGLPDRRGPEQRRDGLLRPRVRRGRGGPHVRPGRAVRRRRGRDPGRAGREPDLHDRHPGRPHGRQRLGGVVADRSFRGFPGSPGSRPAASDMVRRMERYGPPGPPVVDERLFAVEPRIHRPMADRQSGDGSRAVLPPQQDPLERVEVAVRVDQVVPIEDQPLFRRAVENPERVPPIVFQELAEAMAEPAQFAPAGGDRGLVARRRRPGVAFLE